MDKDREEKDSHNEVNLWQRDFCVYSTELQIGRKWESERGGGGVFCWVVEYLVRIIHMQIKKRGGGGMLTQLYS